jgi:hypothetical protein
MSSFKQFVLERTYRFTSSENNEVEKIVDRYLEYFNPAVLKKLIILKAKPEDFYKKKLNERGNFFLGSVDYYDDSEKKNKVIPVEVSFKRSAKDRGRYDGILHKNGTLSDEIIYLFYYKIKLDREHIKDIVTHELYHAKQPYKIPGQEYGKSKRGYYTDPIEVHNYTTNIIDAIQDQYHKNSDEENERLIEYLKIFAREGRIPKDLDTPKFMQYKRDFIKTLYANRNNPKYKKEYQRFINKILWIINELESYDNR